MVNGVLQLEAKPAGNHNLFAATNNCSPDYKKLSNIYCHLFNFRNQNSSKLQAADFAETEKNRFQWFQTLFNLCKRRGLNTDTLSNRTDEKVIPWQRSTYHGRNERRSDFAFFQGIPVDWWEKRVIFDRLFTAAAATSEAARRILRHKL